MLSVVTNLSGMNAKRQFNIINDKKAKSTEKLSSGYRINRSADDAAGLAISEKMRRQIRGLNQGANNIQDGISLCQVADGALDEINAILKRMNELCIKSANDTLMEQDRSYIQAEITKLVDEINRIGKDTTFNEIHIFDIEEIEKQIGKVTQYAASPSAEAGKFAEAYKVGAVYYPAASVDFSHFNTSHIKKLNNAYFSFNCTAACSETFKFVLKSDGTTTYFDKNTMGNGKTHVCYVDIRGCINGNDIVNEIYNIASSVTPASVDASTNTVASQVGGAAVSHTNIIKAEGPVLKLIGTGKGHSNSEKEAAEKFKNDNSYGKVDCGSLTSILTPNAVFTVGIQCSSEIGDREYIHTKAINGSFLGVKTVDVTTSLSARDSINKVKNAFEYISDLRSSIAAEQNRLEHSYKINLNTSENTQSTESQIRDTNMAEEVVKNSLQNILAQSGITVMSQANQNNQAVLMLL